MSASTASSLTAGNGGWTSTWLHRAVIRTRVNYRTPANNYPAADDEDAEKSTLPSLTDEQKMLCTPVVRGYSLKDKLWLNLFVDGLQDIVFNSKAFESLVLPDNQKEMILGFASTPDMYRRQFDDVVEGKGRGMVILLSGPPGTGKTLTAEGVAEEMRTPLFVMS